MADLDPGLVEAAKDAIQQVLDAQGDVYSASYVAGVLAPFMVVRERRAVEAATDAARQEERDLARDYWQTEVLVAVQDERERAAAAIRAQKVEGGVWSERTYGYNFALYLAERVVREESA